MRFLINVDYSSHTTRSLSERACVSRTLLLLLCACLLYAYIVQAPKLCTFTAAVISAALRPTCCRNIWKDSTAHLSSTKKLTLKNSTSACHDETVQVTLELSASSMFQGQEAGVAARLPGVAARRGKGATRDLGTEICDTAAALRLWVRCPRDEKEKRKKRITRFFARRASLWEREERVCLETVRVSHV